MKIWELLSVDILKELQNVLLMVQLLLDEGMIMIFISSVSLDTNKWIWSSVITAVVRDFLCTLQGRIVEIYGQSIWEDNACPSHHQGSSKA